MCVRVSVRHNQNIKRTINRKLTYIEIIQNSVCVCMCVCLFACAQRQNSKAH